MNNDSTLGNENGFKTSAQTCSSLILVVMHDHVYNIKIIYKKNRRRKKGKRLLLLTKVNFTDVKKGLRAN